MTLNICWMSTCRMSCFYVYALCRYPECRALKSQSVLCKITFRSDSLVCPSFILVQVFLNLAFFLKIGFIIIILFCLKLERFLKVLAVWKKMTGGLKKFYPINVLFLTHLWLSLFQTKYFDDLKLDFNVLKSLSHSIIG